MPTTIDTRARQRRQALAPVVVLSAGGIGSPRVLHNSGLMPAGACFFSDPVVAIIGSVPDILQPPDRNKLREGSDMARSILKAAGAKHIFKSWHFAAHPGGSVRIGEGVDTNLRTATPGLYVCDASVIPGPWGLPPTLTLLCLDKRLGAQLAG